MRLQERDYLLGMTESECLQYGEILPFELQHGFRPGVQHLSKEPSVKKHLRSLFPNNFMNPSEVRNNSRIDSINEKFLELLNDCSITERDILNFINKGKYFHIPTAIIRGGQFRFGHHGAFLFPEFQLGISYKADYLLVGKSSGGYEFIFVEFENCYKNITCGDGELGETFRKGIQQVKDWKRWLDRNFFTLNEYWRKNTFQSLPDEFNSYDASRFHYVVVAGRRSDFKDKTYLIAREYRKTDDITLMHYDNLYDYACDVKNYSTF